MDAEQLVKLRHDLIDRFDSVVEGGDITDAYLKAVHKRIVSHYEKLLGRLPTDAVCTFGFETWITAKYPGASPFWAPSQEAFVDSADSLRAGNLILYTAYDMMFEGLRYGNAKMPPRKLSDEEKTICTLSSFAHHSFQTVKAVAQIEPRNRHNLFVACRQLENGLVESLKGAQGRAESILLEGLDIHRHFDQLVADAKNTLDVPYFEAYGVKYSDVLRLVRIVVERPGAGAALHRDHLVLSDTSEGTVKLLRLLAGKAQASLGIEPAWFGTDCEKALRHLSLALKDVAGIPKEIDVVSYLHGKRPFLFVSPVTKRGQEYIVCPSFVELTFYDHVDWIQDDRFLMDSAKSHDLSRNVQRWIRQRELADIESFKHDILKPAGVADLIGPILPPDPKIGDLDVVGLQSSPKRTYVLLFECKRVYQPAMATHILAAVDYAADVIGQAKEKKRKLLDSTESCEYVEKRLGGATISEETVVCFALISRVTPADPTLPVIWGSNSPKQAKDKIIKTIEGLESSRSPRNDSK